MTDQPKKEKVTLTTEELSLISQVLYKNQWNGQQWQEVITPLVNKLAAMIDEMKNVKRDKT